MAPESGGTGPERKWGAPTRCKAPEKNFWSCPPLFGYKSTISRFGERFRDGQYSLVSFLFAVLLLTVPPRAQPFVKVGARASRVPWSRRHCKAQRKYVNMLMHTVTVSGGAGGGGRLSLLAQNFFAIRRRFPNKRHIHRSSLCAWENMYQPVAVYRKFI